VRKVDIDYDDKSELMYGLERVGLVLQIVGILLILGSQIWLLYRVRRKRRSLKEAFVLLTSPKEGLGDRLDYTLGKITDKEFLERFPLAKLL